MELNLDANDLEHDVIEENIDGEESKEVPLSSASRVHGPSFVRRGIKRDSSVIDMMMASENDTTS